MPNRAPAPAQAPKAAPRSSCGKVAPINASAPGVSRAAPIPCAARPAINSCAVGASPQAMDDRANRPTPIRNTRRRPNRSPAAPPIRTSAPSVNR